MSFYKTHPNAKIGSPGPLQGYNTGKKVLIMQHLVFQEARLHHVLYKAGVVIYNLAKMRQNKIYNNYLKPKSMLLVQQKYGFT